MLTLDTETVQINLVRNPCKTVFTELKAESYSSGVQGCSELGKAMRLEEVIAGPCGEIDNGLVN